MKKFTVLIKAELQHFFLGRRNFWNGKLEEFNALIYNEYLLFHGIALVTYSDPCCRVDFVQLCKLIGYIGGNKTVKMQKILIKDNIQNNY